jgi:hypothetical protein
MKCNIIIQCKYFGLSTNIQYYIVIKMLSQNILKRRHSLDEIEVLGHESHTSFLASVNWVPSCELLLYVCMYVLYACTIRMVQDRGIDDRSRLWLSFSERGKRSLLRLRERCNVQTFENFALKKAGILFDTALKKIVVHIQKFLKKTGKENDQVQKTNEILDLRNRVQ